MQTEKKELNINKPKSKKVVDFFVGFLVTIIVQGILFVPSIKGITVLGLFIIFWPVGILLGYLLSFVVWRKHFMVGIGVLSGTGISVLALIILYLYIYYR